MRHFLDTEFNGAGGELLSMGLVSEFGGRELYLTLPLPRQLHPWVERHVIPYLGMSPIERIEATRQSAAEHLEDYFSADDQVTVLADWPEDFSHFCALLSPEPGHLIDIGHLRLELVQLPGFSAAANSKVPHNALHDARALRAQVLADESG